MVVQGD